MQLLNTLSRYRIFLIITFLIYTITFVSACNAWCTCTNPDGSHLCTCRSKSGIGENAGTCPCCEDLNAGHQCCAVLGCGQRHQCSDELVSLMQSSLHFNTILQGDLHVYLLKPSTNGHCCPTQLQTCKDGHSVGCLFLRGASTCVSKNDFNCAQKSCPQGQEAWGTR